MQVSLSPLEMSKLINHQDELGYSPLMHAVKSLQSDCVHKLLQLRANANLLSKSFEVNLLYWYKLSCVTGTKVQTLTPEALRGREVRLL